MLLSDPLPLGERRSGTRIAKDAIQGPAPFYSPQSTHAFRSAFAAGRRERFRSYCRRRSSLHFRQEMKAAIGNLSTPGSSAPPADDSPHSANSVSGFTVYPISSHFVSNSSRICALVDDVLCSRTMAPGWIRPRSFSNASSCVG